eukprot:TRINITY_DN2436_c0_g1_i2.p1 TRINITY_DN2436_c0_g1~~TRINITY_DN2436_c0_g1_i2.p1  ORF type:complete len:1251 (+),score=411.48 TRINITY_DN2436_c0_g1_i2:224-3976(+)
MSSFLGIRRNSSKEKKKPNGTPVSNHSLTPPSPSSSPSNGSERTNPPFSSPSQTRMATKVSDEAVNELTKEIQKIDRSYSNGSSSSDVSNSSNLTSPSMDSEPVEATFSTRLRLPGGEELNIQVPKENMTISKYLTAGLNKIKDILGPKAELQDLSVQDGLNEAIQMSSIIQQLSYFKSCIDEGTAPIFFLFYDESSKVKRTDRKAMVTHRTSSFHAGSPRESSLVVQQLKEFQVQILLPSGQTLVLPLNVDDTISEVKNKISVHAAKFDLKPMGHYTIKTPSKDGWLSNENASLGSIPFIEECRHNSCTPKLVLGERGATLTKKEKLINLEIGSLIGSPLCWTQGDSETNQFRKSMTWVRFQERKKAKRHDDGIQTFPWQQQGSKMDKGVTAQILSPTSSQKKPPPKPLMLKLRLPLLEGVGEKTVIPLEGETADSFNRRMAEKYYKNRASENGYILKVAGLAQYIDGDQQILNSPYLQSCIASGQTPQLQLLEREKTEDNDIYIEDFPEEAMIHDPKYVYVHEEIVSSQRPWDQLTTISMWELNSPFRVKILGAENVKLPKTASGNGYYTYVTTGMYHGGELISPPMQSVSTLFSQNPRWNEWNSTNIQMGNIPRAARLCFTIWATKEENGGNKEKDIPLAWVNCQLIDYKHELRQGKMTLNMWPEDRANPIGTCVGNNADINAATLIIELNTYQLPVVFPTAQRREGDVKQAESAVRKLTVSTSEGDAKRIDQLIQTDPLYPLTEADKKLLWAEREICKRAKRQALPKLLRSVCYNNRADVQTMHSMLETWPLMNAVEGLELLDSSYGDSKVRAYAVKCLEALSTADLSSYLLQLVQVLKYESYHDSDLARFLLRRGLEDPSIGHSLFWYLKAEMHEAEISERYGVLLEAYLRGCGIHRAELKKQILSLKELARTANHIKGVKDPVERLSVLKGELSKITFPNKVKLPLNPEIEVSGLTVEKCKFMDSKKLPLWLVFNNADQNAASKYVIFKSGDDLRQDMLTLQMIRLMDKLWKADGLDLRLNAYGCISTGNEQGMIEVVLNSDTVANITRQYGGATAAFRSVPIANWLKQQNPDDKYPMAVDNFVYSCAGYCVATYVLGIGDRHNDNVMITREGRLFHIDFGHFLGNFKKKFGFKRERAPFVFTPDFAYVMGGKDSPDFKKFVDLCCRSYNILRKYANTFINLFAMMLSTGIPELTSVDDIEYLRDAFSLGATEEQAKEKFTNLIFDSLDTKTTRLNNAIHIWVH